VPGSSVPHEVELAEHGEPVGGKQARPFDSEVPLRVEFALRPDARLEGFELRLRPAQALLLAELLLEPLGELDQVAHVRGGVVDLRGAEGPPRPVGPLLVLGELDLEVVLDEGAQPDRGIPEELRRDHRVEDVADLRASATLQHVQVVLGGVKDLANPRIREDGLERVEGRLGGEGQGVDQVDVRAGAELEQAELVVVVEEAIRLRIHGEDRLASKGSRELLELFGGLNERLLCH
jgi:hypothetical protein